MTFRFEITTTEEQRNYKVFTISDKKRGFLIQYVLILNLCEAVKDFLATECVTER